MKRLVASMSAALLSVTTLAMHTTPTAAAGDAIQCYAFGQVTTPLGSVVPIPNLTGFTMQLDGDCIGEGMDVPGWSIPGVGQAPTGPVYPLAALQADFSGSCTVTAENLCPSGTVSAGGVVGLVPLVTQLGEPGMGATCAAGTINEGAGTLTLTVPCTYQPSSGPSVAMEFTATVSYTPMGGLIASPYSDFTLEGGATWASTPTL